jgi:hypothetical protein
MSDGEAQMIFNCQRKTLTAMAYHVHQVEAPDEATAREMMYTRSFSGDWLDINKTTVWRR